MALSEGITTRIRDMMLKFMEQEHTLPWTSGIIWKDGFHFGRGRDGKRYNGINAISTFMDMMINRFDCDEYLTMKEIKQRKGTLNKGAHGVPIVFYIFRHYLHDKELSYREYRQLCAEGKGHLTREECKGATGYYVFNLAQTDLEYHRVELPELRSNPRCLKADEVVDSYLENGGPRIVTLDGLADQSGDGFYSPAGDYVMVYPLDIHWSSEKYYQTLFHELGHSTGHHSRLDRNMKGRKGSISYAREEMVADLCASLLLAQIDYGTELIEESYSYVKGWESRINSKSFVENFMVALGKAEKAANWILGEREAARNTA